ncbi:MAG: hypothetical protein ACR2K5_00045 [Pseudolabrys sp.]
MTDIENHTLRLLQEFRKEFKDFNAQFAEFRDETRASFSRIDDRLQSQRQALIGESVLGRYATAAVEQRLVSLEERLSALEEVR